MFLASIVQLYTSMLDVSKTSILIGGKTSQK